MRLLTVFLVMLLVVPQVLGNVYLNEAPLSNTMELSVEKSTGSARTLQAHCGDQIALNEIGSHAEMPCCEQAQNMATCQMQCAGSVVLCFGSQNAWYPRVYPRNYGSCCVAFQAVYAPSIFRPPIG